MFVDYAKLVLRSYEEKRVENVLSPRLIHPTPALLKEECMVVFTERYKRKDQGALSVFFGDGSEGEVGLKSIKKFDIDKFRPLVNFLQKKTQNPDKKNIELLAWLIDFEPRPFEYGRRYDPDNTLLINNAGEKIQEVFDKEELKDKPAFRDEDELQQHIVSPQSPSNKNRFIFKAKTGIIILIILVVAAGFAYWVQNEKWQTRSSLNFITRGACMYWAGDHYEQVSCAKHGDTLVVALDTFKLKHLKKINLPDTITQNAIGAVWYIKVNGNVEFFTSDGYYPLDPKRKLKPITDYIIQKYIHSGR